MGSIRSRGKGLPIALAAIGSVVMVGGGAAAASSGDAQSRGAASATITMYAKGRDLGFSGPRQISRGSALDVVNATDPKKVGPHTFTLIRKRRLPTTRNQAKNCERLKSVCGKIATAHELDPKTFTINKPDVDVGKLGWDRPFGAEGDTWYTETDGEQTSRVVSARPGTTLRYFCVVHPFMKGKIKVVK